MTLGAVYLLMTVSSVVLTEQVLRRRGLGRVTLDMVHAPDHAEIDDSRRREGQRRTER